MGYQILWTVAEQILSDGSSVWEVIGQSLKSNARVTIHCASYTDAWNTRDRMAEYNATLEG